MKLDLLAATCSQAGKEQACLTEWSVSQFLPVLRKAWRIVGYTDRQMSIQLCLEVLNSGRNISVSPSGMLLEENNADTPDFDRPLFVDTEVADFILGLVYSCTCDFDTLSARHFWQLPIPTQ